MKYPQNNDPELGLGGYVVTGVGHHANYGNHIPAAATKRLLVSGDVYDVLSIENERVSGIVRGGNNFEAHFAMTRTELKRLLDERVVLYTDAVDADNDQEIINCEPRIPFDPEQALISAMLYRDEDGEEAHQATVKNIMTDWFASDEPQIEGRTDVIDDE